MAKRSTAKSKGRNASDRFPLGMRADIAGIVLLAIALLTLFSLLSINRGGLTGAWIHFLRLSFGWGVYVIPFALGGLGLWLIARDFEQDMPLDWEKPAGWGLFFFIFLTAAHLIASIGHEDARLLAEAGQGGGYIGWGASMVLVEALGLIGAWTFILACFFVALILVLDITLAEFWQAVRGLAQEIQQAVRRHMLVPGWPALGRRKAPPITPGPTMVEPPAPPPRAPEPPAERPVSPKAPAVPTAHPVPERFTPAPAEPREPVSAAPTSSGQLWQLPRIEEILDEGVDVELSPAEVRERVRIIEETLASFGVPARVVEVNQGPAVTQFGVEPGFIETKDSKGRIKRSKVKVARISALAKDLALALAASPIRIEAPVPGRPIVGIEVPNQRTSLVSLRSVMESEAFRSIRSPLALALGQDVSGQPVCADLAKMPHLLIAGATGSGKSVCINSLVTCLLCNNTPETLRLLMIDPKRVELVPFNGVPHLLAPVVVDLERVVPTLQWATREMDRRYELFAKAGVRNLEGYNERQRERGEPILPIIVIVIDELADLMMMAPDEVERSVCRIAQMARATGIHLIIATQRPSVDVVTGLIKANFPARISFAVTSQVDSRVILDTAGAEQLLGRGDMLYMAPDSPKLQRLQGCFVSDQEVQRLVRYWKGIRPAGEPAKPEEVIQPPLWADLAQPAPAAKPRDVLFDEAVRVIQEYDRASISLLQRRLRIGYSRAARLIDLLEQEGYVGPEEGASRSRAVLKRPPAS